MTHACMMHVYPYSSFKLHDVGHDARPRRELAAQRFSPIMNKFPEGGRSERATISF